MDDKPNNTVKKLSRKETKDQLLDILHLFDLTIVTHKERKLMNPDYKGFDSLQDTIDFIRVSVKYKLFENDVLGREITTLKKICKDNNIDLT